MPKMPESFAGRLALVLDTTVLSNFAAVGQVVLLRQLYEGQSCTTLMVVEEIQRGILAGYRWLGCSRNIQPLASNGLAACLGFRV